MTIEKAKSYTRPVLFRTIVSKSEQLYRRTIFEIIDVNNRNTNKYEVWHGW